MTEWRLWLSLLKLRVVVLLQVTAIAAILAHDIADRQLLRAMFVGNDLARTWAETLETALVVLVGGSLASGGSMAINMWYDRDIDPLMARTDKRPLPSGELAPGAVLVYGIVVCVSGVVVLALLANQLAAAFAAFSALFYVLVYTMWLKRRTPQNIVIGGLAGALSPLIGWTAAGGDPLALLPWAMVAVIFLWTPPHFWALTLARPGEYAQAGVPMLPVTAGEAATRRYVTGYAAALLLTSLATGWQAGLGYPFLAAAVLLGGRFLQLALKLQHTPSKRVAWTLFGYSNIFLFLLFGAMVAAVALIA